MNAPAPVLAPASPVVFACGDCAGEVLRGGGAYAGVTEIPYGKTCQVHPPGKLDMVATNAVIPCEGWARPQASMPAQPNVPTGPLPTTMGPLTEITTRLVVAWSSADRTAVDVGAIQSAAIVAEMILQTTNGA